MVCDSSNRTLIQMPASDFVEEVRDVICYTLGDDQYLASSQFLGVWEPGGRVPWPESIDQS